MTANARIEEFRPALLQPLLTLLASYFPPGNRQLEQVYHEWLYLRNPCGTARVVFIEEDGIWIAFMALVPVVLHSSRGPLRTYFVVNVLVHPAHQGKNLFVKMIRAAQAFTDGEGSALMGHPNQQAIKAWQRTRMHFQEPLRPRLLVPTLRSRPVKRHRVTSFTDQEVLCERLNGATRGTPQWQVQLSPHYLNWRFVEHPTTKYACNVYTLNGTPAGLQVTRRMRPGVHLMIDSFLLPELAPYSLGSLPWVTVAMRPERAQRQLGHHELNLPLRRQMPMFVTSTAAPVQAGTADDLGLCATDF